MQLSPKTLLELLLKGEKGIFEDLRKSKSFNEEIMFVKKLSSFIMKDFYISQEVIKEIDKLLNEAEKAVYLNYDENDNGIYISGIRELEVERVVSKNIKALKIINFEKIISDEKRFHIIVHSHDSKEEPGPLDPRYFGKSNVIMGIYTISTKRLIIYLLYTKLKYVKIGDYNEKWVKMENSEALMKVLDYLKEIVT